MSLFVAVRPPEAAVEDLQDAVGRVRRDRAGGRLRWQPPGLWHVTLAFLGARDDDELGEQVREALAPLGARPPVRAVRVTGSGSFGRDVLWAGLGGDDAVAALSSAAASLPRLLRGTDAEPDRRPWRAHLTLARGRGVDVRPAARLLNGYLGPAWDVDEVLLVRSSGGPHPAHAVLATIALEGEAA